MTRYWIFDRGDPPQGLPLRKLVERIRSAVGNGECQYLVRRAEGYGTTLHQWDELLDAAEEIPISSDMLEQLLKSTEEWFYNLDARCVTRSGTVRFGVHDSTALFLEAEPAVAKPITAAFTDVRVDANS